MAFHRPQDDAGDGKGPLSQRLKAHRDEVIKPSLKRWLEGQDPGVFAFMKGEKSAERQFAEITALFSKRGGAGKRSQWDRKEKEYALGGKPQTET